jgi:plastocyanin
MSKHPIALLLSAGVLALGVAACGGSSGSSSSSAAGTGTSSSAAATTSAAATSSAPAATGTSSSAAAGTGTSSAAAAPAGGSASSHLTEAANPNGQLAFTEKSLTAKAGTVAIDFTNKSPEMHNFTIQQGTSGPVVGATPTFDGGSKTLTVKLKPGTYTFYCSVPGHRMAGMQGTLTVS